jgi:phage terminase large subunit-like protein
LGKYPDKQIITATYGYDLTSTFARQVLMGMTSPKYRALFPEVELTNQGKGKGSSIWYTNRDGFYKATSRGGTITGLGADVIILDDLIKNSTEARSASTLRSTNEWYDTTLHSRLLPGGQIIFLQTRWAKNDLMGYVLENDRNSDWTYINFPALNEDNSALWPERYSTEYLLSIKERNPGQFACLYQGDPSIRGATEFDTTSMTIYPVEHSWPKNNYTFSSWDTASKVTDHNSYTVGTLWGVRNDQIYLMDYIRDRYTIPELEGIISKKHIEWECKYTLIEDANSGTALIQFLEKKFKKAIRGIVGNTAKYVPLSIICLNSGIVKLKNFNIIIKELDEYPNGNFSDCVTSVVNAIKFWHDTLRDSRTAYPYQPFISKPRRRNILTL